MKKARVLLIVTALLTALSGPSFAAEDSYAESNPAGAPKAEAQASDQADSAAADRTSSDKAAADRNAADQAATKPAQDQAGQTEADKNAVKQNTDQQAQEANESTDQGLKEGDALGASPKAANDQPEKREVKVYRACTITSVISREGRIMVNWKRRSSGEGYCVYRRKAGQSSWTRVKRITRNTVLQYRDESLKNGTVYEYKVLKYNTIVTDEAKVSYSSPAKIGNTYSAKYTYLSAPEELKYSKRENVLRIKWEKNPYAEKYIIMYSRNSLFRNAKILETKKTNYEIKGIDSSKRYYISVRCLKGKAFSDWARSSNYSKTRTSDISYVRVYRNVRKNGKIVKKNGKPVKKSVRLDIRIASKQKLYGYDTVQGAASDGRFSYTILLNKSNGYSRIIKMKGGTSKVVRVSKVMYLGHGNGMTYNPDRKTLVVAHGASTKGVLSVVRAKNLRYLKKVRIKYGKSLTGYNGSNLKGIKTYSGVAYLPGKKQYVLTPNEKVACVYLDRNFKPIRYQTLFYKFPNQTQGTHAEGELLFRSASPKGSGPDNAIFVYDTFGQFLKKIRIPVPGELESLYYIGSKLYGAIYRSRWVARTKTVKERYYVKKHGKRVRRTRKKKVKYYIFYRDSYVVRISNY